MASDTGTYRSALAKVLRSTASAYGYTLTVSTTVQVLAATHGSPRAFELWLFLMGGVSGFAVLEAGLLVLPSSPGERVEHAFPLAGALNLVAVSVAFGAGALVAHGLGGTAAWPLAAFSATVVYLTLAAGQAAVVGARASSEKRSVWPGPRRR